MRSWEREPTNSGGAVAGLLERPQLGEDQSIEATADQHDMADALDLGGHAERPHHVGERIALVVVVAHLGSGPAQRLHHQRDRAGTGVEVGQGERDALGALMEAHHHELAGPAHGSDVGRLDLPRKVEGDSSWRRAIRYISD